MSSSAVGSISSLPYYSYLNQLQGKGNSSSSTTGGASNGSGSSSSSSLVSSLLGGGNAYTSSIIGLLQPDSSGSFNPIATLLNGPSANSALTNLYTGLYDSVAAASLVQAGQGATVSTSSGSGASTSKAPGTTAQSLIAAQTQASIAYNKTLQQNAANVLKANSKPLVA